uniref:Glycerophosphodiester phosphodiesterase domain containing 2 n=1 Tax=Cynoglossus semilaevis TaxID=244447 RepID=A0A3P8UZ61_CYNSE
MPRKSCGRVCCRGLYSCHWETKLREDHPGKHACCGFSVVLLVSLLSLCWMYICLVTFNDQEDVNWEGFKMLKRWVNFFMLGIIVSAVLTSYCVLLLLIALFHVAIGEKLDLHWFHMIFLSLGVLFIASGLTGISLKWKQEWPTVPLSLQATGPFLQFGAVVALTLLSPLVFRCFLRSKNAGCKVLIALVFVVISAAIFLCPLLIHSPCLLSELPEKPKLIGHRGAPMKAPENTIMAFNRSVECGVTAFETDVQLSKDRIPFLMHDNGSDFLLRTTNVKQKFPDTHFSHSANLTWEELQSLNAGEWFVEILWLPPDERDAVSLAAPGFIQVYNNLKEMLNKRGTHLNMKYSKLSTEEIRELRSHNKTVNLWVVNEPWLFSLLWCAGASSVTTNSCHLLRDMERPSWVMSPLQYRIAWTVVDAVAFLLMTALFIVQRTTHSHSREKEKRGDNTSAWNELMPFLPTV